MPLSLLWKTDDILFEVATSLLKRCLILQVVDVVCRYGGNGVELLLEELALCLSSSHIVLLFKVFDHKMGDLLFGGDALGR